MCCWKICVYIKVLTLRMKLLSKMKRMHMRKMYRLVPWFTNMMPWNNFWARLMLSLDLQRKVMFARQSTSDWAWFWWTWLGWRRAGNAISNDKALRPGMIACHYSFSLSCSCLQAGEAFVFLYSQQESPYELGKEPDHGPLQDAVSLANFTCVKWICLKAFYKTTCMQICMVANKACQAASAPPVIRGLLAQAAREAPTPQRKRGRKPKKDKAPEDSATKDQTGKPESKRAKRAKGKELAKTDMCAKAATNKGKAAPSPTAKSKPAPKSGPKKSKKADATNKDGADNGKGKKRKAKELTEEQKQQRALASRKSSAYHRVRKECLRKGMSDEASRQEARKASCFAILPIHWLVWNISCMLNICVKTDWWIHFCRHMLKHSEWLQDCECSWITSSLGKLGPPAFWGYGTELWWNATRKHSVMFWSSNADWCNSFFLCVVSLLCCLLAGVSILLTRQ